MKVPPSFPALFKQHVVPKIEELCLYHGAMIALGDEDWADAHLEIVCYALNRGAGQLPDNGYATIKSIDDLLLHEVLNADALIEYYQANPVARWRDAYGRARVGAG